MSAGLQKISSLQSSFEPDTKVPRNEVILLFVALIIQSTMEANEDWYVDCSDDEKYSHPGGEKGDFCLSRTNAFLVEKEMNGTSGCRETSFSSPVEMFVYKYVVCSYLRVCA